MIQFDDNQNRVTIDDASLTLQPLSYRMLKRLRTSQNSSVSVEQAVWGMGRCDGKPEALKQRVFIFRKSLTNVGSNHTQSVRGEGYRLAVEQIEQRSHSHPLTRWLLQSGIAV